MKLSVSGRDWWPGRVPSSSRNFQTSAGLMIRPRTVHGSLRVASPSATDCPRPSSHCYDWKIPAVLSRSYLFYFIFFHILSPHPLSLFFTGIFLLISYDFHFMVVMLKFTIKESIIKLEGEKKRGDNVEKWIILLASHLRNRIPLIGKAYCPKKSNITYIQYRNQTNIAMWLCDPQPQQKIGYEKPKEEGWK